MLVISFFALAVLWPQPRLEQDDWRPLKRSGRALASMPVQIVCGAIGVFLLVVTILGGYVGVRTATDNFAPTFLMIIFWVGMVFASILFGGVYRAFSPFRALGRAAAVAEPAVPGEAGALAGGGVPVVLHLDRARVRLGREPPSTLVTAALGYTILTLAAQCYWGVETWSRRGEAFAVYFDMFARMSMWEVRDGVLGVRRPLGGLPQPGAGRGHRRVRRR